MGEESNGMKAFWVGWTLTGSRNSDDRKAAWGIGGSFQPANSVSHFSVIEYAQPPGQGCFELLESVFYASTEVVRYVGKRVLSRLTLAKEQIRACFFFLRTRRKTKSKK